VTRGATASGKVWLPGLVGSAEGLSGLMVSATTLGVIYFFYGLAFFSMGLAILLEMGHGTDPRLRHALRPLAAFGLIHGGHEWLEMAEKLGLVGAPAIDPFAGQALRVAILAISFLALSAFGASLLAPREHMLRWSLAIPIGQALVWGVLVLALGRRYAGIEAWTSADILARYVLAIPGAVLACGGLIRQQREFRSVGMAQFGRDCLYAAGAFAVYGLVGQLFTRAGAFFPANVLNQDLFLALLGFPVQLLRALAAIVVAVSVIRFLRSSEVETKRQIAALQGEQLKEARRREAQRAELLRRVVGAQEAERQRIARELHDETGQALTAIGLGLRGAATVLRQDVDKAAHHLRELEALAVRSLNELQRVIADLRPSHLDDLGLPAALRWYAEEVQGRAPIQIQVEVRGETGPAPSAVSTALFRIAQEAITNAVRHSHGTCAKVGLEYGPRAVCLWVEDNGWGFDAGAEPQAGSWGLVGIEERARLLGGRLRVTSSPGQGARIEVTIPYAEEDGVTNADTPAARG
jgi:signal transduction histidine kinase